jgi:hypothetical protein
LLNQVLKTNRNTDYWEWKFFNNPAGRALSVVTLSNGKVVGQLGAIPVRFSVKGRDVTVAQELDFAILDNHRRYDIFFKMVILEKEIFLKEDVDFSYGLPNKLSAEITQAFTPNNKISPIPRLCKVLDVKPFLRQRLHLNTLSKILSPTVNTGLRMIYSEKMVIPEGMQLKRIHRFDERFDTFWKRIKNDYLIMTVRDSAYLNWRYVDAPHMNYEIFCLEQTGSNEVMGLMVLGEQKKDYLIGQIFDIVTPKEENSIISHCLLRFALNRFRKKKAAVVRCWMFSHSHVYPELVKTGFVRRKNKERNLTFQNINLQELSISQEFVGNSENWYFTSGDSDIN